MNKQLMALADVRTDNVIQLSSARPTFSMRDLTCPAKSQTPGSHSGKLNRNSD
jgi:hypothetical protein